MSHLTRRGPERAPLDAAHGSVVPTRAPIVIVCAERRGRVLLIGPNGEPVHDMLTAAGVPNTGEELGASITAARLADALRAARAAGWTVTPSRAARRAQAPRGGRR